MAIITICRGSLSGGRAVARCLAQKLGYREVAEEILEEAAGTLGVHADAVRVGMETTPGLWSRIRGERSRTLLAVRSALADACLEGDLIYHGLAGPFLLQGLPGVVRVRLIAPMEKRVRALSRERHAMPMKMAEEFIHNVDQERRRWVRLTFGVDVEDPGLYDLTVNLRSLSLEAACAAIAETAARPEFHLREEGRAALEIFARECRRQVQDGACPR